MPTFGKPVNAFFKISQRCCIQTFFYRYAIAAGTRRVLRGGEVGRMIFSGRLLSPKQVRHIAARVRSIYNPRSASKVVHV
jgi:hypothetical protein